MFKHAAFFAAALVGPAAIVGLAATSTPAAAAEAALPRTLVYYTDLDLGTPEGQKILQHRLVKAARKICQMDQAAPGSLMPSASSAACYRKATTRFDGQIAAATRDQDNAERLGG